MELLRKFGLLLIFSIAIQWPLFALARKGEALFLEGGLGTGSQAAIAGIDGSAITVTGNVAYLRFHLPMVQSKTQLLSFTLSNQFYDGVYKNLETDQSHYLAYTAIGAGLSYRYRFILIGGEYQTGTFRQSLIGTGGDVISYQMYMPNAYGGLWFRMGHLGIGALYYSKSAPLTKDKTGLEEDKTYAETGVVFGLSYHWTGKKWMFFKSLFF